MKAAFLSILAISLLLAGALGLAAVIHRHAADMPWARLDLGQPIGLTTGRRLAALSGDSAHCTALLTRAGVAFTPLPPRNAGPSCGYDDAVRFLTGGSRIAAYAPASVGISCPVAAALAMWEWDVVQPAALRHFGRPVEQVDHFGSYACRRLYGRATGGWSEHATANAIDIAGFRLRGGRRITIASGWNGDDAAVSAFLRDVHDGACRLFATVLGPGYNAAHHDHFHLDQAARGSMGWRACR